MAIGNGSWVVPATILGTAGATLLDGTPWLAQPPHVGVCSDFTSNGTTTVDVLWDNGVFDDNVPVGTLVELDQAQTASVTGFSGQVVRRVTNNQSGEYIGVVVLIAGIFLSPSDETATDFVVVKTLGPSHSYWVALVSDIEVVAGR